MEDKLIIQSESDKSLSYYKKSSILLFVFSTVSILSLTYVKGFDVKSTLKAVIFLFIINLIFICYLGLFREKIFTKSYAWWMIGISYVISILCMIPNTQGSIIPYWILGGVILSCTIDLNAGILMTYCLTVLTAWVYGLDLQLLVMHLMICTLLCILTGFLRSIIKLLYINVIIICTSVTLLIAASSFNIKEALSAQGIMLILFCVFVTILSDILKRLEDKWIMISSEINNECINNQNEDILINEQKKEKAVIDIVSDDDYALESVNVDLLNFFDDINDVKKIDSIDLVEFDLDALRAEFLQGKKQEEKEILYQSLRDTVDENNILLLRMKNENPKLYRHGKKVADLSKKAAYAIEADELLAYAGGFYHDVGKLSDKEVIEEGVKLIKEYSFPECIEDIIRQSSVKSEYPKSREAAIIMLTDSILSAISFFKKQNESLPIEKAVDKILDVRMEKGVLNESGLSIRDFNFLKTYFKEAIKS